MAKIFLHTVAYNAEKTICRCIDSILNQTYSGEIDWYILDNGSIDNTFHILAEYEKKYAFIHAFHIDQNCSPQNKREDKLWNQFCKRINLNIADDDFYCTIDSDDEYKVDFFVKMISFMNKYNLDVGVAGNDFINSKNNELMGVRKISRTLILDKPDMYNMYFPCYHSLMRPVWGKLYRGFTLKNYVRNENLTYGSDTWFVFHTLRQASRVGILNESLYKYYVNPKSVSYEWDNKRLGSDKILTDNAYAFLLTKCGRISKENDEFILQVYFYSITDTLRLLLNARISTMDKFVGIFNILLCEYTQKLIAWTGYIEKKETLFNSIINWLLMQPESHERTGADIVTKIIIAMHLEALLSIRDEIIKYLLINLSEIIPFLLKKDYNQVIRRLQTWFKGHHQDDLLLTELEVFSYHAAKKPAYEVFKFYMEIKKNRSISYKKLNMDIQLVKLTSKSPLLKNLSPNLLSIFSDMVYWVLKDEPARALENFVLVSQDVEIADNDLETYILLGQNLSALTDNAEVYIFYIKIWIRYLIDCSRYTEAEQMLQEFKQILPDDKDLIELHKKIK